MYFHNLAQIYFSEKKMLITVAYKAVKRHDVDYMKLILDIWSQKYDIDWHKCTHLVRDVNRWDDINTSDVLQACRAIISGYTIIMWANLTVLPSCSRWCQDSHSLHVIPKSEFI